MLKRWLLSVLAAFAVAGSAQATTVLPTTLETLIDQSAAAFQGTVLQNRVERDARTGQIVTYTKFKVSEVLKGSVTATHEIKQIGGRLADGSESFNVMGVPRFQEGEEYVVFLNGVSASGFSSPVGLHQGRFSVSREGGIAKVGNGRDFKEMAADIPGHRMPPTVQEKLARAPGAVKQLGLDEFKQLVRDRLEVTRGTAGSTR